MISTSSRLGLDLREHIGGRSLVEVVDRLVREPTRDATHDPIEDREHVGVPRHGEQHERQAVAILHEHAVGHDEVEVDVQVDQATEPLHERDRAGERCAMPRARDHGLRVDVEIRDPPDRHLVDAGALDDHRPRRGGDVRLVVRQAARQGLEERVIEHAPGRRGLALEDGLADPEEERLVAARELALVGMNVPELACEVPARVHSPRRLRLPTTTRTPTAHTAKSCSFEPWSRKTATVIT